jgi:hypothetical protein
MASLVKVRDICTPILTRFDPNEPVTQASFDWQDMCIDRTPDDPLAYVSLVESAGKPVGWLDFTDLVSRPDRPSVSQVMTQVEVSQVVTADTSVLDSLSLFRDQSPYGYLVLDLNQIVGFFSYNDLLSAPFRACLFSFLIAVEELMDKVLATDSKLAVSKMDSNQIGRLTSLAKKRIAQRGHSATVLPSNGQLLKLASFTEKMHVLAKCKSAVTGIPALSDKGAKTKRRYLRSGVRDSKEVFSRLDQLEKIRNTLAHPGEFSEFLSLLPKEDLKRFMAWLGSLEEQLANFLEQGQKLAD